MKRKLILNYDHSRVVGTVDIDDAEVIQALQKGLYFTLAPTLIRGGEVVILNLSNISQVATEDIPRAPEVDPSDRLTHTNVFEEGSK